jgi:SagB-type dehydrogenase family enzyme
VRRKSDFDNSVEEVLREAADPHLLWPSKTLHFEKSSSVEVRERLTSSKLSIAELYHENSKLFPEIASQLAAANLDVGQFRRAAKVTPRKTAGGLQHSGLTQLLSWVTARIDTELYYAVEVRLIADSGLFVYDPEGHSCSQIKSISTADIENLRCAVNVINPLMSEGLDANWIFIVGRFARNALLFGDRGYRRTLLEAGAVLEEILQGARQLSLKALSTSEFDDRDVDAIIEVDGVEEGTLVAVRLTG